MAERKVARAAGRTKKAAMATAMTSHAIRALSPYGVEDRQRKRIQELDGAANEGQHERPADEGG